MLGLELWAEGEEIGVIRGSRCTDSICALGPCGLSCLLGVRIPKLSVLLGDCSEKISRLSVV